jgi:hypothetical protein
MITNFDYGTMTLGHVEDSVILSSMREMKANFYPPKINSHSKRILTIMACHTNSLRKYNTVLNNLKYFCFMNNDIVVINSRGESHSDKLRETLKSCVDGYCEIPNNAHLDIGKWCFILKKINYKIYDHVIFTNDSFLITSPIVHFFNKMMRSNVELYGYNDSTQIRYHYQSYLFALKKNAVDKLIALYLSRKHLMRTYEQVVENIELNLVNTFRTHDCFLKIGWLSSEKGRNIFFNNDTLYRKLLRTKLLPFIKLKRLVGSGA